MSEKHHISLKEQRENAFIENELADMGPGKMPKGVK